MSAGSLDFTMLTVSKLASLAVNAQNEMDVSGLEETDITDAITSGRAKLEVRPFGFAVIELTPTIEGKAIPHLWLLFIAAEHRQMKLGRQFVREILDKYAHEYHMSLYCYGGRRRAFFGKLGFRVESRQGDLRRMTTGALR